MMYEYIMTEIYMEEIIMIMKNNWIALILVLGILLVTCMGCDQQQGSNNPAGTPGNNANNTSTTQKAEEEAPITQYGNFTTEGPVRTLEDIFKDEIKHTEDTFATGSSYSDEKIANIYKIGDYVANYETYIDEYNARDKFNELYAETGFTMDFGFGAEMVKHYIGASGETYDYTNRMSELLEFPKVAAAQSTCISAAMKAAENLVKDGQSGVAINQVTPVSFSSLRATDGPIYFALGSYQAMADLSDVQRNGDAFSATVTFRIVDNYAWAEDGTEPEFTSYLEKLNDDYRLLLGEIIDLPTLEAFCQADMAQLHYAGLAQNFLAHGMVVYNVTWTAGQTFDQATVVPAN